MHIDFSELKPSERYHTMVQSIIPRPIAWVLSESTLQSKDGIESISKLNLAPYSFFTGICSDPPLLVLSAGKKAEGNERSLEKDTRRNIRENKHFVVHIASTHSLDALNKSAATLDHAVSEIDTLGLETCKFEGFPLPRLIQAPIALGCTLYQLDEIGNTQQAVIYGEIKHMYVDDNIVSEHPSRLIINPELLDPLARLGGNAYSGIGPQLVAERPK